LQPTTGNFANTGTNLKQQAKAVEPFCQINMVMLLCPVHLSVVDF